MNDEPIYNYVRGQGWVVSGGRQVKFIDIEGKEWYAVDRMPVVGERWDATNTGLPLEERVKVYRTHNVDTFSRWYVGADATYYNRYWAIVPAEGDQ